MDEAIIRMENIVKTFPGVVALQNVSLQIRKGTVHALVGENGAGKSTLMKILGGIYQPDTGKIYVEGIPQSIKNPKMSMQLGISMVHQELNAVPQLSIADNLFLGREPKTTAGLLDQRRIQQKADELMREFQLNYDVKVPMKTLSVAKMQMIEIIKAVSSNARVIVMDEPTSSITDKEVEILFGMIRALKEKGIAIVYISHRMEELSEIADEITVIRDGKTVAHRLISEVDQNEIVRLMVGREIKDYYPQKNTNPGEVVLEVKELSKKEVYQEVSFDVRKGEILGISGLIGAGRSEVILSLFGLMGYDSGEIRMDGEAVRIRRARDAIRHGIALVPEDRKGQGLVLIRSIRENISLPFLARYRHCCLRRKKEQTEINQQMRRFSVKASSMEQQAVNLSGGNQQKVVLAKWLLEKPRVLIMDEPTRGIDVGAKQEIYRYMVELAEQGISTIMVSSELPEILGMSDRIIVMANGRITEILERGEATSEKIMRLSMEDV